jgi:hypothetical protein
MKIPFKNKIFAWYLRRGGGGGVLLKKIKALHAFFVLRMRQWSTCSSKFQCSFARSIWSVIQVALGLYTLTSIDNIFGNSLNGIDYKYSILLRLGAMTLIWSLWLYRNNKVFNNKNTSLLQVIYRCTGTLRIWSQLHRVVVQDLFIEVCTHLEDAARDLFS